MALSCLLVDDSPQFLEAASKYLAGDGIAVVGVASTIDEALTRVHELEPDVTIVDIHLKGESGFDLAWRLAAASDEAPTSVILTSSHAELDFAELIAVTPVLGFIPKNDLCAAVISDFLADRNHGHGCRHEALVYSSADELAAGSVPFIRQGLARGDHLLVVLREAGRTVLQRALDGNAAQIEFADAVTWYQSPEHAFQQYTRYVDAHLERGAHRIRVVAEVVWPQDLAPAEVAGWKRYEAGISAAMASVPVSFVCTYDTEELPAGIITDARRTHPVMRTAEGARPSTHYSEPGAFVRSLDRSS
jgi:CheY-like chemotaxis protein